MRTLIATVLAVAAVAPAATTGPATSVTNVSATLTGTVNPQGEDTRYFFQYGTSTDYGINTTPQDIGDGNADVAAQAAITGLTGNTTYHYRVVAVDASGDTTNGADRTFTTDPNPNPPTVANQRARNVAVDAAELTATVDPNGTPTTYYFEYGTTTRYGSVTPTQSAGSGTSAVAVSAAIGGLAPRTTYRWRLVATNTAGTTRGRSRSFTTARLPTAVSLSISPRRVPWGGSLALGGRVTGTGVSRIPVALQVQRFPFDSDFTEVARSTAGSDGGYLFRIPNQWTATRYRVVTRTSVVATSPVVTADSVVRAGARVRHVSRRRARVEGSALPDVAAGVRLQRRNLSRRWHTVKRKTVAPAGGRTSYRFSVVRQRRTRRYRVVVQPLDNGAHVSGRSRTVRVRARPRR